MTNGLIILGSDPFENNPNLPGFFYKITLSLITEKNSWKHKFSSVINLVHFYFSYINVTLHLA